MQAKRCAAVHIRPTLLQQWIMVPCSKAIWGASFVCEIKINTNKTMLNARQSTVFRDNRECPRKTINVRVSCLHIINSLSGTDYIGEVPCGKIGLDMFLLPHFFFILTHIYFGQDGGQKTLFCEVISIHDTSMVHCVWSKSGKE